MKPEASGSAAGWVTHATVVLLRHPRPRAKMLQAPGKSSAFRFAVPPGPRCSWDRPLGLGKLPGLGKHEGTQVRAPKQGFADGRRLSKSFRWGVQQISGISLRPQPPQGPLKLLRTRPQTFPAGKGQIPCPFTHLSAAITNENKT